MNKNLLLISLSFLLLALNNDIIFAEEYDPARWKSAIQKFEEMDAKQFPAKGEVLFVGSSSIRLWDLKKYFPELVAINRGFGGSHIEDATYYAEKIILPYQPKMVVVYAGDNDISHGYKPSRVRDDFLKLVAVIHKELPKTKILFIAIKPSIKRWALIENNRAANQLIHSECEKDQRLTFVDIDKPMIGKDGTPKPEFFAKDNLHLSPAGYELWTRILKLHLK